MKSSGMSSSSRSSAPDRVLRGAVFFGEGSCEHQAFLGPVAIHQGTGLDVGTLTLSIGNATIFFNSYEALISALADSHGTTTKAVAIAG